MIQPVTLRSGHVTLEPLTPAHAEALWAVARDPDLWRWQLAQVRTRADFDAYLQAALDARGSGTALPFAIVASGEVAGTTRFGNVDLANRRVEIGWTWLGTRWQRTDVNTRAKLLLMRHAFGALGVRRVEWKTDARNVASRAALARLGATEEGTLRQHAVRTDGTSRDSVYFSLLADEWPAAEARLTARLAQPAAAPEPQEAS